MAPLQNCGSSQFRLEEFALPLRDARIHRKKCGSHTGQIFGNLIEQTVEMLPNEEVCDVQDGD